jgi:small subunit ribosomal protein S16
VAVKIRLKRLGKVRVPQYRIVVVDSRKKRDGKVIEEIVHRRRLRPGAVLAGRRRAAVRGRGPDPRDHR